MSERRYQLGLREHRGMVAGWRGGQVAMVAAGASLVGGVLALGSSPLTLGLGVAVFTSCLAGAVLPFQGRTVDEWLPVLLHHVWAQRRTFEFRLKILAEDSAGVAVVDGRLVVVLRLSAEGFALKDPNERLRLVEGFSAALGSLCRPRGLVERASWSFSSGDTDNCHLAADRRRRGDGPRAQLEDYAAFVSCTETIFQERAAFLTLSTGKMQRSIALTARELLSEARAVCRNLEVTGHHVPTLLSPEEVQTLLLAAGGRENEPGGILFSFRSSFPSAQLDDTLVASWWVAEWSRHEVGPDALSAILLGVGKRRMSVVFEPIEAQIALRRTQVAATKGSADDELRRRGGFLPDRRLVRQADQRVQREEELVGGHQSLRFVGFLAVEAKDEEEITEEIRLTEAAAVQAGLVLRRLWGDHPRGFLAALPLCRGLS